MLRKFLILASAMTIFVPAYSIAEEVPAAGQTAPETAVDTKAAEEKINDEKRKVLLNRVVEITGKLDQSQATHFFVMYANYSMVSMVKKVEKDVGDAIQKCVQENPDIQQKAESRFEGWKTKVGAAMTEAQANMNNMAVAQTYMSQQEVQELFAMVDATRIEADSRFQRIPVSTPEACEFMLTKMDETEKTMVGLLTATLASYPSVLQKNQK